MAFPVANVGFTRGFTLSLASIIEICSGEREATRTLYMPKHHGTGSHLRVRVRFGAFHRGQNTLRVGLYSSFGSGLWIRGGGGHIEPDEIHDGSLLLGHSGVVVCGIQKTSRSITMALFCRLHMKNSIVACHGRALRGAFCVQAGAGTLTAKPRSGNSSISLSTRTGLNVRAESAGSR